MLTIEDLYPIAEAVDDAIVPADGSIYMFTAEELVEFTNKAVALAQEREQKGTSA